MASGGRVNVKESSGAPAAPRGADAKERRKTMAKVRTSKELFDKQKTGVPKWSLDRLNEYKPKKAISDEELAQAKKVFWELDRDGSGSIEEDEISYMLRQLGQSPTEEMVKNLIQQFDTGEKDGKIQLREFLNMYAHGLGTQNSASVEDAHDTFRALEGDPHDGSAKIPRDKIAAFMKDRYDMDVDVEAMFGTHDAEISVKQFEAFLVTEASAGKEPAAHD